MKLNVSKGMVLDFLADGIAVSGKITNSQNGQSSAIVEIKTEHSIRRDAKLTLPDVFQAGGCGVALPRAANGGILIELSVRYSSVDIATIGK
jgi:hypothetical protein